MQWAIGVIGFLTKKLAIVHEFKNGFEYFVNGHHEEGWKHGRIQLSDEDYVNRFNTVCLLPNKTF